MARLTAPAFTEWVDNAKRGQRLPYHDGLLMKDRTRSSSLDELATVVYDASLRGLVVLVQTRLGIKPLAGINLEDRAAFACKYEAVRI